MADSKTIVLGDEYDDALRSVLLKVLRDMGAQPVDSDWAVAGSQQIETLDVMLQGSRLHVEAETFIGLQISGDPDKVDAVQARVRQWSQR